MTLQMILALGVLIFMIVLIMMDWLPFGAPPILACFLLVVLKLATVQEAFAGFVNNSVVMIAGFMVVLAAAQKTQLLGKVKDAMVNLTNKGGYKSYILLVILCMLGASLIGPGATGYYVLILALVSTIPYNKKMPTSKLMLPLGFATNHPLIPINVALHFGVAVSVLESNGWTEGISMVKFAIVTFIMSMGYLIWAILGYKLLPDHPIAEAEADAEEKANATKVTLSPLQEKVTIVAFIVSVVCMMMMNTIGTAAYVIPGLAGCVLIFMNVVSFKEFRENYFAPVILMMAGVIGVADALANTGFTAMVGEAIAARLGGASPFVVIFLFALLTSTFATFTGSNMGSVYIGAPVAIASCMALGLNPTAAAVAVTISGWNGGYMPIDGMPAMIYGMGNYKLSEFWKFSIPMYFIRLIFLCVGAVLVFPM